MQISDIKKSYSACYRDTFHQEPPIKSLQYWDKESVEHFLTSIKSIHTQSSLTKVDIETWFNKNLRNTNPCNANLRNANLRNANLRNANLRNAKHPAFLVLLAAQEAKQPFREQDLVAAIYLIIEKIPTSQFDPETKERVANHFWQKKKETSVIKKINETNATSIIAYLHYLVKSSLIWCFLDIARRENTFSQKYLDYASVFVKQITQQYQTEAHIRIQFHAHSFFGKKMHLHQEMIEVFVKVLLEAQKALSLRDGELTSERKKRWISKSCTILINTHPRILQLLPIKKEEEEKKQTKRKKEEEKKQTKKNLRDFLSQLEQYKKKLNSQLTEKLDVWDIFLLHSSPKISERNMFREQIKDSSIRFCIEIEMCNFLNYLKDVGVIKTEESAIDVAEIFDSLDVAEIFDSLERLLFSYLPIPNPKRSFTN